MASSYHVIGLMSGTSLDGVDLAWVTFTEQNQEWDFKIEQAITVPYPADWIEKLKNAPELSGKELIALDRAYGKYLGKLTLENSKGKKLKPLLLASHGHTIFHQPNKDFTFQLGSGASLAVEAGIPVVSDFRSTDVAKGGQGAPLVPVGDKLLFGAYEACLNLGGFSNISFDSNGKRVAFDICPVNIVLNYFAERLGKFYDKGGNIAREGEVDLAILKKLNALAYYQEPAPKSLAREWLEKQFMPVFSSVQKREADCLNTLTEHIADQIARVLKANKIKNVLITGGGAHNTYLLERLKMKTECSIVVPTKEIVDYKEALIFAFLSVLRYRQEINCYASVTGASNDSIIGCIYQP